jgi:soluble lytic murein transglycosylase
MRTAIVLLASALSVAGLPTATAAQVRVGVGPDGRTVLSNDQVFNPSRSSRTLIDPRQDLMTLIEQYALQRGLDPVLVRAMIQVESGYDPSAVSRKGAIGLMQLMPATAAMFQVSDPFDPAQNIGAGTAYMRQLLDSFDEQLVLALAGYNAGPEAVRRYGGVPPYRETQQYVERVLRLVQGSEFTRIPDATVESGGRRTYLVRKDGRLVMTTTPPGS